MKKEITADDVPIIDLTDDDAPTKLHGNTTDYNRTSSTESILSDETYVSSDTQGNTHATSSGYPFSDPCMSGGGYPYSETEETEEIEETEAAQDLFMSQTEYSSVNNPSGLTLEGFAAIEGDRIAENISHGKPFPVWLFDDKTPEEVTQIPYDINGFSYYTIKVHDHKWQ